MYAFANSLRTAFTRRPRLRIAVYRAHGRAAAAAATHGALSRLHSRVARSFSTESVVLLKSREREVGEREVEKVAALRGAQLRLRNYVARESRLQNA